MATVLPPTEVEILGSGATPNKGASRESFRKWIRAYLNLFGSSGTPEGALAQLNIIESGTNQNGRFIKFFNGTLICEDTKLVNASVAPGIAVFSGDHAATFVGNYVVNGGCLFYAGANQTGNRLYGLTFASSTAFNSYMNTGQSPDLVSPSLTLGPTTAQSYRLSQTVTGRWKA